MSAYWSFNLAFICLRYPFSQRSYHLVAIGAFAYSAAKKISSKNLTIFSVVIAIIDLVTVCVLGGLKWNKGGVHVLIWGRRLSVIFSNVQRRFALEHPCSTHACNSRIVSRIPFPLAILPLRLP